MLANIYAHQLNPIKKQIVLITVTLSVWLRENKKISESMILLPLVFLGKLCCEFYTKVVIAFAWNSLFWGGAHWPHFSYISTDALFFLLWHQTWSHLLAVLIKPLPGEGFCFAFCRSLSLLSLTGLSCLQGWGGQYILNLYVRRQ